MLIINAPKIFALAFKLVKPLLPKETLAKMDIYGQHEDEWKDVLRSRCAQLNKLPVRWGGTLKSTDVWGADDVNVWLDGPIPLSYFTDGELAKICMGDACKFQSWPKFAWKMYANFRVGKNFGYKMQANFGVGKNLHGITQ